MHWNGEYANSTTRVVLLAYLYVVLEWLFLATKPSFLDTWGAWQTILALATGALPFVCAALIAHAIFCGLTLALEPRSGGNPRVRLLLRVIPASIAVATALMLIDNFTYTVFGWGIVRTGHATAPIYWVGAAALFAWLLRWKPRPARRNHLATGVLVVLSLVAFGFCAFDSHAPGSARYHSGLAQLPNIVMFASDGVNADHMSAYGYSRKTTPNLDRYMDRALVAVNAFTNSSWTTGSLTSMMTGKYPATTKVMYPPYTLQGRDAYQSLPRILHRLGYSSLQETVRYYADGPDLNWKDSFDIANGRKLRNLGLGDRYPGFRRPLQFSAHLYTRLSERVLQLLFIKRMPNRHASVTSKHYAKVYGTSDKTRMQRVLAFIAATRHPFFIHIHLMGTHCCGFHPDRKVFSAQAFATKADRKRAAFDDAILESDAYFGQLMATLKQHKLLDHTLVIYTSDHNKGWTFRSQVPLIFIFPQGKHHGRITAPTQLLDVAPTVLDYLKVPIPKWMEGRSLLRPDLAPYFPIYNVYRLKRTHFKTSEGDRLAKVVDVGPPTWGLGKAGMVVCQRWYIMRLADGVTTSGNIGTYRGGCPADKLPSNAQARTMISRHLHERGFRF